MDQAEADRIKHLSRALRSFPLGPLEQVLPYAFPIVDAGLWECFITQRELSFLDVNVKRHRMTTGSTRYTLAWRDGTGDFVAIQIRIVNEQATHITITPGAFAREHPDELQGLTEATLQIFIGWLNQDQLRMTQAREEAAKAEERIDALWRPSTREDLEKLLAAVSGGKKLKLGTHKSWPEDDWAWEQVNTLKRPRQEVRAEWLQHLSPERRKLKDPADSFRHAVNPNRKGGRKPEI